MTMDTQQLWKEYGDEFYFFLLKKVQDEEIAKEILQNSFFKIHRSLSQLKESTKARAWAYQIVRNEMANFFSREQNLSKESPMELDTADPGIPDTYCCFEKFLQLLPPEYFSVIEQVYLKGNSQQEASDQLGISLANTKARIRRAKALLKKNFQECCHYDLDANGLLTGEPDCSSCEAV